MTLFRLPLLLQRFQPSQHFRSIQTIKPRKSRKYIKYGVVTAICSFTTIYYIQKSEEEKKILKVTLQGTNRFFRSLCVGLTISIDYWWSLLGVEETSEEYQEKIKPVHQRAADRILEGCLKNGGLYIKLGQGLVSLAHILPEEYVKTLQTLHDKCLTRKKDEVELLFKEEFGKSYKEIFSSFNEEAIAAASLAQVFHAKTLNGEEVAVKVQYNDLQERYTGDIGTINILLKIISWMHPKFDFQWVLNDLKDTLAEELDFINEGKNAERCANDLAHFKFVYVPKVYWDFSTKRILTTEFIHGIKVDDVNGLKSKGFSLLDVDFKLFKTFAEQIFHTGFVHADPHPGNVFVRRCADASAEIVLIDHGLYEYLNADVRHSLCHLWKAIVLNNVQDMKKYSAELGVQDYTNLAEILTQRPQTNTNFLIKRNLSEEDLKYMTLHAKNHFDKIMNVLRAMPRSLLLVVRNLNTVRSIAREHGDPVDRFRALARSASKGAFVQEKMTVLQVVRGYRERARFEFMIWYNTLKYWMLKLMIRGLVFFGFSLPDGVEQL